MRKFLHDWWPVAAVALFTTFLVVQTLGAAAAGIIVAVSVQVMYGVLRVRLDRLTADLEAAASEILGILAPRREAAA